MSIERTYYCDGPYNPDIPGEEDQPDGCPHNVRAVLLDGDYIPAGIKQVRSYVQGATYEELHFCSWDCLMRYAASQHPTEYIA